MARRFVTPSWIVALTLVVASAGLAQPQASRWSCEVPPFRGARAPGGAIVALTVVNDGRPCPIRILSDVDARLAATELHTVQAPRHGTLEFARPDVALYTPSPGYTGADTYVFAGRGPVKEGKTVDVRVTVRATVVKP